MPCGNQVVLSAGGGFDAPFDFGGNLAYDSTRPRGIAVRQMVGHRLRLTVHDLHPWGSGVGQDPQYGRIYVPFAFPGDEVEAELTEEARTGQWNARLISPFQGICPVAGECGACIWPAASYAQQLEWKERLLRRQLKGIRPLENIAMEIHSNGANTGFRSRLHLHANFYRGRLEFGYYAWGARTLVPIGDCPVAEPPIRNVLAELAAAKDSKWSDEDFGFGIELTHLAEERLVSLVLYGSPQRRSALLRAIPRFSALPSRPRVLIAFAEENPTYIWQRLPNATMYTRPGCFQQVNRRQSDVVRALIAARFRQFASGVFFDLCSGSGNYSLPLHPDAGAIYGCDDNPIGIAMAHHNVAVNKISNAHYVCGDAGEVLAQRERYGWPGQADFIVCDPARFGMAKQLPSLIAQAKPRELVLVSNNASAFVKDARGLLRAGFAPVKLDLVDFFPNTPHWNAVSVWRL